MFVYSPKQHDGRFFVKKKVGGKITYHHRHFVSKRGGDSEKKIAFIGPFWKNRMGHTLGI